MVTLNVKDFFDRLNVGKQLIAQILLLKIHIYNLWVQDGPITQNQVTLTLIQAPNSKKIHASNPS